MLGLYSESSERSAVSPELPLTRRRNRVLEVAREEEALGFGGG